MQATTSWLQNTARIVTDPRNTNTARVQLLDNWFKKCPQELVQYLILHDSAISTVALKRQICHVALLYTRRHSIHTVVAPQWFDSLVEYFTLYPLTREECGGTDQPDLILELCQTQYPWSFSITQELGSLYASPAFGNQLPWDNGEAMERILNTVLRHAFAPTYTMLVYSLEATTHCISPLRVIHYIDRITTAARAAHMPEHVRKLLDVLYTTVRCSAN